MPMENETRKQRGMYRVKRTERGWTDGSADRVTGLCARLAN